MRSALCCAQHSDMEVESPDTQVGRTLSAVTGMDWIVSKVLSALEYLCVSNRCLL